VSCGWFPCPERCNEGLGNPINKDGQAAIRIGRDQFQHKAQPQQDFEDCHDRPEDTVNLEASSVQVGLRFAPAHHVVHRRDTHDAIRSHTSVEIAPTIAIKAYGE